MKINIEQLKEIVITASNTELLPRFNSVTRSYKADGSIVTEADLIMQDCLTKALQLAYPDIELLGEEMSAEQQQALLSSGKPLWCLDPVDGTSNFAAGIPYFSVSLALIENGQVTFGLVYDPVRSECFTAQIGQGATLNDQALASVHSNLSLKRTIALIDFKRLTPELATQLVSELPYGSQRSLGSIALELCWIAARRGHIYLHGKQQLWDYAAAQLILSEAGGYACTLDGEALFNNQLVPRSTIAALDIQIFKDWCDYLRVPITEH
ncbi:MAG: inositol monophosphatase [Gammaproteobacteria bacterium]|nr:MAG: inositol monophosphatase [Gammaproteobacteria bacterium]RKZ94490.1 MAG: inositol monophosphatase [Gammaproteobacteria bacterium]RKZ97187.1 MAG: inositol monophosphatase [Gammaproteobacteria bacterium]RLA00497.1 MAG: inositol monophosphatase [Gammaproteobacteria bacterium]